MNLRQKGMLTRHVIPNEIKRNNFGFIYWEHLSNTMPDIPVSCVPRTPSVMVQIMKDTCVLPFHGKLF